MSARPSAAELFAAFYDLHVTGWAGEIPFHLDLLRRAPLNAALELACGTGRVALALAQAGARATGLDISPELLAVARAKSAGADNPRWALGDMRAFDLGETFGLVTSPGHSFQFLRTPAEQRACLACCRRQVAPGGLLVLHLDHPDPAWQAGLPAPGEPPRFSPGHTYAHPISGQVFRRSAGWTFEPATQTAFATVRWEALDGAGAVADRWEQAPLALRCTTRAEVEDALARTGFALEAVLGDFSGAPPVDGTSEMIFVARRG